MSRKTNIVIMKHEADKAGLHYDLRIKDKNDRWLSWRMIYDAKKQLSIPKSRNPITAIKTTIHSNSEALFTGQIPKGEYGAGKITKYCQCEITILKTDHFKTHLVFTFDNGKYMNEKWVLFNISAKAKDKKKKNIWILFKANKKGEYHGKEK